MSTDGEVTKRRRNIAENFNRLSRAHERYRRQTDDRRASANSERSLKTLSEFNLLQYYTWSWKIGSWLRCDLFSASRRHRFQCHSITV